MHIPARFKLNGILITFLATIIVAIAASFLTTFIYDLLPHHPAAIPAFAGPEITKSVFPKPKERLVYIVLAAGLPCFLLSWFYGTARKRFFLPAILLENRRFEILLIISTLIIVCLPFYDLELLRLLCRWHPGKFFVWVEIILALCLSGYILLSKTRSS